MCAGKRPEIISNIFDFGISLHLFKKRKKKDQCYSTTSKVLVGRPNVAIVLINKSRLLTVRGMWGEMQKFPLADNIQNY